MKYRDILSNWSFNTNGDLNLTTDYGQSLKERLNCPIGYLNRYYNDYGSEIPQIIGEHYNEEKIKLKLQQTLNQDKNITDYSINEIKYSNGLVNVIINIDGVDIELTIGETL